jgi:GAF domain-containing protein
MRCEDGSQRLVAACGSVDGPVELPMGEVLVPNPDTLLDSLERFAAALTSGYGIGDVLHNLTEEMSEVLHLTGAGVTLVQGGQQRFVTAAIESIADLERVQENWQQGPCIEAVASAAPVAVPDIAAGDVSKRWPDYTMAAMTEGIQAVVGIPMLAEGVAIGAVNLYESQPRDWSAEDLRVATIFAHIATGYLFHASAAQQQQRTNEQLQQRTNEQLQQALDTRLIIEQAKGVLATKRETTVDDAFHLLRKYARDHRARIHDVSQAVVKGDLLL